LFARQKEVLFSSSLVDRRISRRKHKEFSPPSSNLSLLLLSSSILIPEYLLSDPRYPLTSSQNRVSLDPGGRNWLFLHPAAEVRTRFYLATPKSSASRPRALASFFARRYLESLGRIPRGEDISGARLVSLGLRTIFNPRLTCGLASLSDLLAPSKPDPQRCGCSQKFW